MFKGNKATGLWYRILVTLRQQLFWAVASAIRNVFRSCFRKSGMSKCSIYQILENTSAVSVYNAWKERN